jgi:transcriptional regulator with XRE-family HTH domain
VAATDTERPRLHELRTELGWTQQELADRLARLAWMERRERVGVNADMVAKWERGAKGISPRYRELLCRLFGVTPDQLGLKNASCAVTEPVRSRIDDQSLVAMLDKAAGLLDQLGAAGTALAPHMLHAWKDAVTTRRTMVGLLDPGATDPVGHARAVTASVADFEHLAERYHALYETADPAALLTSVAAHVRMAQDKLSPDPENNNERCRLLRNLADVAILAGRLAGDDMGNTMSARSYYSVALDTAREADDDQLIAIAHGHAAQLAAHEGMTTTALDHLTAAGERARSTPAIASWLATLEATIHADRGDHTLASEALQRAHTALDQPGGRPAPTSFHRSGAQLIAARGRILLQVGDYSDASKALTAALDQLSSTVRRPRVLILIDLAAVELRRNNFSESCRHAALAADLLQRLPYATGAARLRAFRDAAARPISPRALRLLDKCLGAFAA